MTSARQRGTDGPWVGEVVNNGRLEVQPLVGARIIDATGREAGFASADTCPGRLLPGEHGAFELFFDASYFEERSGRSAVAPLHAEINPEAQELSFPLGPGWLTRDGLSGRVLQTFPASRAAVIEIKNDSPVAYRNVQACAILRGSDGAVLEVGRGELFPSVLQHGATGTMPIFFNSLRDGEIEVFAQATTHCDFNCSLAFDAQYVHVTASRVVQHGGQRSLVAVAELTNDSGQDLDFLRLEAYADVAPQARVRASFGCGYTVSNGTSAAASFTIPLETTASRPSVVITGVEGFSSAYGGWYRPRVSGIRMARLASQPDGLGTVAITATLHNDTSQWLTVTQACATVRDANGAAIGVALLGDQEHPIFTIEPHATLDVAGLTYVLGTPAKAEASAFGALENHPPAPPSPPRAP